MGGFFSHTKRPPVLQDSVNGVFTFPGIVQGEPAAENPGLSNTVGTVALALPGNGAGGTNQDGGTSSFFVNLTDNDFLDADFTVFAAIPDMSVINAIMALPTIDRTTDPVFGAGSGNLAFSDVPVMDNGYQVFIKRAFVISDTLSVAKAMAGVQSVMSASSAAAGIGSALETPYVAPGAGGRRVCCRRASFPNRRRRFWRQSERLRSGSCGDVARGDFYTHGEVGRIAAAANCRVVMAASVVAGPPASRRKLPHSEAARPFLCFASWRRYRPARRH